MERWRKSLAARNSHRSSISVSNSTRCKDKEETTMLLKMNMKMNGDSSNSGNLFKPKVASFRKSITRRLSYSKHDDSISLLNIGSDLDDTLKFTPMKLETLPVVNILTFNKPKKRGIEEVEEEEELGVKKDTLEYLKSIGVIKSPHFTHERKASTLCTRNLSLENEGKTVISAKKDEIKPLAKKAKKLSIINEDKSASPVNEAENISPAKKAKNKISAKKAKNVSSARKAKNVSSAKKGKDVSLFSEGKSASPVNEAENISPAKKAKNKISAKKAKNVSSARKAKNVSSAKKGKDVSLFSEGKSASPVNEAENISSAKKAKNISSTKKAKNISSAKKGKDVSSFNEGESAAPVNEAKNAFSEFNAKNIHLAKESDSVSSAKKVKIFISSEKSVSKNCNTSKTQISQAEKWKEHIQNVNETQSEKKLLSLQLKLKEVLLKQSKEKSELRERYEKEITILEKRQEEELLTIFSISGYRNTSKSSTNAMTNILMSENILTEDINVSKESLLKSPLSGNWKVSHNDNVDELFNESLTLGFNSISSMTINGQQILDTPATRRLVSTRITQGIEALYF